MTTHSWIGEFNPQREDWTSYTERSQEYFAANEIEEAAKQKAVLLSTNVSADENFDSSTETDREII